jgi:hypothetical protein
MSLWSDQSKAFLVLALAVLGLFLASAWTVLNPEPFQAVIKTAKVKTTTNRSPAGLVPNTEATLNASSIRSDNLLNVGCIDTGNSEIQFQSTSQFVRVRGDICGPTKSKQRRTIIHSAVANATSGSEATIFYPNLNSFTTDLISLHRGVNSLKMRHELFDGTVLEREVVVRLITSPRESSKTAW